MVSAIWIEVYSSLLSQLNEKQHEGKGFAIADYPSELKL